MNTFTSLLAKPVAEEIKAETRDRAIRFAQARGRKPKLVVVLVGDNPASMIYVSSKGKTADTLGISSETLTFPATATAAEIQAAVSKLNADPHVDGILIQRPLPPAFREEEVLYWVHPSKDVDAFHPENTGRLSLGLPCFIPCTPAGIMELLRFYKIETRGKIACVVGRSSIVGKPMATLLLRADATVLHAHSRTPDLRSLCRQADIVVAAIGKAKMSDASYVRQGAVVVDVGINRDAAGKVVGDVDFEAVSQVASAVTPVPGGVGPMTIAMLMKNTVFAAEQRAH